MADSDQSARAAILAKLATSREELRSILDPPRKEFHAEHSANGGDDLGGFPRSRTMQMLMSGRGLGTLGAAAAGLLVVLARAIAALRAKQG